MAVFITTPGFFQASERIVVRALDLDIGIRVLAGIRPLRGWLTIPRRAAARSDRLLG
jgi:hypothetical protein